MMARNQGAVPWKVTMGGIALSLVIVSSMPAAAVPVSYLATSSGQTATADFIFLGGGAQLQIILTETTPLANPVSGADAVLTGIGFLLPDAAVLTSIGTVTVGPTSTSVGFSPGCPPPAGNQCGPGSDVSFEWGATEGGEKPIDTGFGVWDFVSTITAQVGQFAGIDRDGPPSGSLNGPQGGLLDDAAAVGGTGIIDNSVIFVLTLDANPALASNQPLSPTQQAAFLVDVTANSIVEFGSNAAFGFPGGVRPPTLIPSPSTLVLLGIALAGVAMLGARRRGRRTQG